MIIIILGAITLVLMWYIIHSYTKLQRVIMSQQDTIQKLLNREPVTYKEVGKEQPKEDEVRYSAWGSRMLTKDDYNKEP